MNKSEYSNHPIWKQLDESISLLTKTAADSTAEETPDRDRIKWIATHLKKYKTTDERLFTVNMLQPATDNWTNSVNELTQLAAGTHDALPRACQAAERALEISATWPQASAARGGRGRTEKEFFDQYEKATEDETSARVGRIAELTSEAEARDAQHAAAVGELETRIAELTGAISTQTERITTAADSLDQKVATIETAAAEAQTDRTERFNQWLEERNTQWVSDKAQPIIDIMEERRQKADERLAELERLGADVERVAGKTASAVLARDYGSYSSRQWVTGLIAYGIGVALLVAFGIYLLMTVGNVDRDAHVSWQYISLKLGLTITVIAASTVLFQIGHQSLRQAAENKQTELELRAIGPFLADVNDPEATKEAKIGFINRSFGQTHGKHHPADSNDVVKVSLVEKIINLAMKSGS